MLNELLILLFILIIIIIIYAMSGKKDKAERVEGFENVHRYYIGGDRGETIYNKSGNKLMEINKKDQLINYKNNKKKTDIEHINAAPDPYHHIFEYNDDKIKVIPKKGEAKIQFDDESKEIEVRDNKDKSITYFKFRDKTICNAKISDNDKYKYMFTINDVNMVNLLPLYFVTFVLLQRSERDEGYRE